MSALPRPATPGPWRVQDEGTYLDGICILGGGPPGCMDEGSVAFAMRHGRREADPANAAAIAALPDWIAERDHFRAALVQIAEEGCDRFDERQGGRCGLCRSCIALDTIEGTEP